MTRPPAPPFSGFRRWLRVIATVTVFFLLVLPGAVRAWDNLDIPAELRRPGVRLVVVEFYADWCKPCKAAVPQWNELHKRYKDRGLRLIVISVGEGGTCANPGWQPDKVVCDFDGKLQTAFGANSLPQAFLYSWQGNLLVKHGHFEGVKKAVEAYYKSSPRILVGEPEDQDGKKLRNGGALREIVRTDLRRLAKFEMVAGDKELASLRELRRKGYELNYDDAGQCELGREVSANSELKVKLVTMGDERTLVLQLYSVESGCMLASSKARIGSGGLESASFEAVGALIEQLIGRKGSGDTGAGGGGGGGGGLSYEELMKKAQEIEAQKKELEKAAKRRAEIEAEWKKAQEVARQDTLPVKERVAFMEQFLARYPEGNPFRADAEALIEAVKSGQVVGRGAGGGLSYEELMKKAQELKDAAAKSRAEIEAEWKKAREVAAQTALPVKDRVAFVEQFLARYPDGNPFRADAEALIKALKSGQAGGEVGKGGVKWVWSEPAGLYFTKTEVTVAQYRACLEAGVCKAGHHWTKSDSKYCNWGYSGRDNHPMNCVDWYGAEQFCKWVGGRLPTEDEWYAEASNGGTRGYPWGSKQVTCDLAIWGNGSNTDGCGEDHTWEVCSKPAGNSVSGLCDMSGNVWEWTSSVSDSKLRWRVVRGGSWYDVYPENLRASARLGSVPAFRSNDGFGVRCVRVSR